MLRAPLILVVGLLVCVEPAELASDEFFRALDEAFGGGLVCGGKTIEFGLGTGGALASDHSGGSVRSWFT